MGVKRKRLFLILLLTGAIGACGGSETTETTAPPPPATEAEMKVFCERYDELRAMSWGEMTAGLIEVAPAEIEGPLFRTSQPPGESWAEDREAVEDFLDRCDA